jgi:hypothetical protein
LLPEDDEKEEEEEKQSKRGFMNTCPFILMMIEVMLPAQRRITSHLLTLNPSVD